MRWNPWQVLREHDEIEVEWRAPFVGLDGASWPDRSGAVVMLRRGLTQVERRCALAHELAHVERGGGSEHPDPVVRRREEARVDRIAAARLVPADELAAWLARRGDEPTTARDVADEWRVTTEYAALALDVARELARTSPKGD